MAFRLDTKDIPRLGAYAQTQIKGIAKYKPIKVKPIKVKPLARVKPIAKPKHKTDFGSKKFKRILRKMI